MTPRNKKTGQRPATLNRNAVVVEDHSRGEWLRIGRGPVSLSRLSFGAAADYAAKGGQRVVSDFSPAEHPIDISGFGAEVWPLGVPVEEVVGAFVLGTQRHISIRARFAVKPGGPRRFYVRACCGDDERVAPVLVRAEKGEATNDLLVLNLPLDRVATIRESWRWEFASADQETGVPGSWNFHASMPVRVYITAAPAINPVARESFFHLACFVEHATNQAEARDSVWQHFRLPYGGVLTNVRGQQLTMWRTSRPGGSESDYISRSGQALVQHGDASCTGWAHLLTEVFAIHGIKAAPTLLEVDREKLNLRVPALQVTNASGEVRKFLHVAMIIKGCRWSHAGSLEEGVQVCGDDVIDAADFCWKLNVPEDQLAVSWDQPDVTREGQMGHLAAGSTSTGVFSNHVVTAVEITDAQGMQETWWYDPCYGIGPCKSLLQYQHELMGDGSGESDGGLCAVVGCRIARHAGEIANVSHGHYGAHPAVRYLCLRSTEVKPA